MSEREDMRLVALGFGYTARAFMRLVQPASVVGTTRSEEKADELHLVGVRSVVSSGGESRTLSEALRHATHVLVSAGPTEEGDPFLHTFERDLAHAENLKWIGYLSTIGVYGDHHGALIDERASCRPTQDRAIWRLEAEAAWAALGRRLSVPVGIFRIAGIYGPGRNPLVALKEGRARRIIKQGQIFNRIHVDDIASTLAAATEHPRSRIYNLADDEPTAPEVPVTFAAELMGVEPPPAIPFEEANLSPMARSFYGEVKRVSNRRIHQELGVSLAYPTYREGLTALWESGLWQQ